MAAAFNAISLEAICGRIRPLTVLFTVRYQEHLCWHFKLHKNDFSNFTIKSWYVIHTSELCHNQNYFWNIHHKFISVFNQIDAQNLFHNKFYFMPLHVSSTCVHHQEVKIVLHSLWYHHTYRCDDTRGCVMQFWPPDDRCDNTRGCVTQLWPPDDRCEDIITPIGVMIPEAV